MPLYGQRHAYVHLEFNGSRERRISTERNMWIAYRAARIDRNFVMNVPPIPRDLRTVFSLRRNDGA